MLSSGIASTARERSASHASRSSLALRSVTKNESWPSRSCLLRFLSSVAVGLWSPVTGVSVIGHHERIEVAPRPQHHQAVADLDVGVEEERLARFRATRATS